MLTQREKDDIITPIQNVLNAINERLEAVEAELEALKAPKKTKTKEAA